MKTWQIENVSKMNMVESVHQREENEVKVKISKVALSSSDLSCFAQGSQKLGVTVPGHSAIGYVSEANPDSGLQLGTRVVLSPFISKNPDGENKVDTLGVDANGFLSDFICLPQEYVHQLPDGIPDDEAIFTENIALALNIFNKLDCDKGEYLVIVGAGTLGLILAQLAIYYQMVPILVDLDEDKLALAKSCGIYYTLDTTVDNLSRRVEEITAGRMSDYVVYVGESLSLDNALRLCKDGGTVAISGYLSSNLHKMSTDPLLDKDLTVKGVSNGYGEMPSAINILANQLIKLEGLITQKIRFDELPKIVEEIEKYPYKYNNVLVED